ncbi:MAG: hypothetical protein ACR2GR_10580 [Rhodothermales bacterium]
MKGKGKRERGSGGKREVRNAASKLFYRSCSSPSLSLLLSFSAPLHPKLPVRPFLPVLPALLALFAACSSELEPFTESTDAPFALYGYLDASADTQFVRVSALRQTAGIGDDPLHAEVMLTNLGSGEQVVWRDSLLRLDDGTKARLFYAPLRVDVGAAYRLDVRRTTDGAATRATTEVPPRPGFQPGPPEERLGTVQQTVYWLGLTRRPSGTRLRYRVGETGDTAVQTVDLPYLPAGALGQVFTDEGVRDGWGFPVALSADRREVLRHLERPPDDSTLVLYDITMRIERLSAAWQDQENPANIENGFGFFGAVAAYEAAWQPDSMAVRAAGYVPLPR